jgi:predicted HicB family RNase H-like nuclease
MNADGGRGAGRASGPDSLSATQAEELDRACDRFEADWRAGGRPDLAAYLAGTEGPERVSLARELIAIDIHWRGRTGERPTAEEYLARFAGDAFAAVPDEGRPALRAEWEAMGREPTVDELLRRWQEARERRESPTVEDLCADCPEKMAETVAATRKAFEESVGDDLEVCAAPGQEPESPFSGKLPIQVSPKLHRDLRAAARSQGVRVNTLVGRASARVAMKVSGPRRRKPGQPGNTPAGKASEMTRAEVG